MPRFLVPFRYLIAYLAASICFGEGFAWYRARMFVIVAKSGLVPRLSHNNEPTYDLILVTVFESVEFVLGIESTGLPDLNGVRFDFVDI